MKYSSRRENQSKKHESNDVRKIIETPCRSWKANDDLRTRNRFVMPAHSSLFDVSASMAVVLIFDSPHHSWYLYFSTSCSSQHILIVFSVPFILRTSSFFVSSSCRLALKKVNALWGMEKEKDLHEQPPHINLYLNIHICMNTHTFKVGCNGIRSGKVVVAIVVQEGGIVRLAGIGAGRTRETACRGWGCQGVGGV